MVTPFERAKAAWKSPDRAAELNRAIEAMAAEGVARVELDEALGLLLDEVRVTGADDETEEIINSIGDRLHGWCHASRHIRTGVVRLPTKEEIAKLPRWARVAFAARCARRVLPLFRHKWPDAPDEYAAKLTWAVEVGERAASHAGAGDDWAPPAGALVCAAYVCDAVLNANRDRARAVDVIRATSAAVAKFKDEAENIIDPHIGELFHVITNNASVAIANGVATSQATYNTAEKIADTAIRRDFDTLRRLAETQKWTDDTPVSTLIFGPMWPDGPPANWPNELEGGQPTASNKTVRKISELLVGA